MRDEAEESSSRQAWVERERIGEDIFSLFNPAAIHTRPCTLATLGGCCCGVQEQKKNRGIHNDASTARPRSCDDASRSPPPLAPGKLTRKTTKKDGSWARSSPRRQSRYSATAHPANRLAGIMNNRSYPTIPGEPRLLLFPFWDNLDIGERQLPRGRGERGGVRRSSWKFRHYPAAGDRLSSYRRQDVTSTDNPREHRFRRYELRRAATSCRPEAIQHMRLAS